MIRIFLALLLSASAFANVFGPDRRVPAPIEEMPYNMIGKLFADGSKSLSCTASLVAANWVLTSLHCVTDVLANAAGKVTFKLAYSKGKHRGEARVTEVIAPFRTTKTGVSWYPQQDYAFLKLNISLGKSVGWFKIAPSSLPYLGHAVLLAGYSSDVFEGNVLVVDKSCTLMERSLIGVTHSCHSAAGASGGPLFTVVDNIPMIIALNKGHYGDEKRIPTYKRKTYTNDYANVAVDTVSFYQELSKLKDD